MTVVVSIPFQISLKRGVFVLALLLGSHPLIRASVDGNLEVLTTIGVLILLAAYHQKNPWLLSAGVLLASAKPQVSFLLMAVIGAYVLKTWPWRRWGITAAVSGAVVGITMLWIGQEWLQSGFSPGHTGWAGLGVLDDMLPMGLVIVVALVVLVATIYLAFRDTQLSRPKVALLIAAQLILSPYASLVSFTTLLVIGVGTLLMFDLWVGLLVYAVLNYGFFTRVYAALLAQPVYDSPGWWWNTALLIVWTVLAVYVYLGRDKAVITAKQSDNLVDDKVVAT